MVDSVFTKIIKGEIPCHKVFEDDKTLAFLDIYPAVKGQVVVIPKKQMEFVWELDDADYQALMSTVKKVATRLKQVLKTNYVGVKIEGVDVPHAHVKLYPFNSVVEYDAKQDMTTEPNHATLAKIAQSLAI